ncbi:MAG: hypothetical protein HFH30_07845 [Eubacterium sp.]|nr:hypothetical protein [Eubacterium sp.]
MSEKVVLGSNGIKRVLKGFSPVESVAEYIWNGYDANATEVKIWAESNAMGGIHKVTVMDNGCGIDYKTLDKKFKPFYESNKMIYKNENNNSSLLHGKNGIGRLTFFTFAHAAKWTTVYRDGDRTFKYTIVITEKALNDYTTSIPVEIEDGTTGTVVEFDGIKEEILLSSILEFIKIDFAWFIELNAKRNINLVFNGEQLDYSKILKEREQKKYKYNEYEFDVVFCRWEKKLHQEYSKYYYLNHDGKEVYKENTTLNNKGDDFYHSVYVCSSLFSDFSFSKTNGQLRLEAAGKNREDEAFKYIKREIDKYIREKRDPFIRKSTKKFLNKLEDKEAYPEYNLNNPVDKYKKECLDELLATVFYIEPRLLGGLDIRQLKVVVRMFGILMETGEVDSFVEIMENVIDMTTEERNELVDTLKYTSLAKINKTIRLLKDRAKSVANLKNLVYNEDLKAGEINAIQPFMENNYWLLGEKYHLVSAEEPSFEEALRRFTYILTGEKKKRREVKIDSEHAKKQMDIFAVRQMPDGEIKRCIVVELKHPKVILSMKELDQVKTYMGTIVEEPNFKAGNIEWEFYLIGNKYNDYIKREIANGRSHGEKSLVYYVDNCKIYVKTWREIFTEFEINYDFLYSRLQLQQEQIIAGAGKTRKEILRQEQLSSAKMPDEFVLD